MKELKARTKDVRMMPSDIGTERLLAMFRKWKWGTGTHIGDFSSECPFSAFKLSRIHAKDRGSERQRELVLVSQ